MERFGSFRVVGELGRGGMGIVYLGVQDGLQRPVAIKVLGSADDSLAGRLRHEATVLSELQHPHIVGVLDVGERDGRPYLVMPYMPGGTLADVLRRDGSLRPGQVTGVVAPLAEALAAAHARGVLHRDVKPGNVLLSAAGDPYLSDFGIATGSSQTKSSTGELLGTIGYVAPETVAGEPASAASDVYALGVVAYTALSGRGPLAAESLVAALEAARTGRHVPLTDVAPATPPALVALVQAAMSLDPADRPSELREFARALRAAATPEQIEAAPDRALALLAEDTPTSLGARASERPPAAAPPAVAGDRRRRTAFVAAAVVAVLVVGSVAALAAGNLGPFKDTAVPLAGATPTPTPSASPSRATSSTSAPTRSPAAAPSTPPRPSPTPSHQVVLPPAPPPTDTQAPQPKPSVTAAANTAPTLAPISNRTQDELTAVSITLAGSDREGGTLTYGASGLPTGVRLSGNHITGTVSSAAASVTTTRKDIKSRTFAVTATVRDSKGATGKRTFSITVHDTHTTMRNYIGKYGCNGDSGCSESVPNVAALTTPSFSCYADGNKTQAEGSIWRQSIAPGTVIRWGAAAKYWYYQSSGSNCENVPRGW
ncbi:MAG: pknB 3 [Frankiales bacterium]|nr:pknB 3 [Frankiales bacterium]